MTENQITLTKNQSYLAVVIGLVCLSIVVYGLSVMIPAVMSNLDALFTALGQVLVAPGLD